MLVVHLSVVVAAFFLSWFRSRKQFSRFYLLLYLFCVLLLNLHGVKPLKMKINCKANTYTKHWNESYTCTHDGVWCFHKSARNITISSTLAAKEVIVGTFCSCFSARYLYSEWVILSVRACVYLFAALSFLSSVFFSRFSFSIHLLYCGIFSAMTFTMII